MSITHSSVFMIKHKTKKTHGNANKRQKQQRAGTQKRKGRPNKMTHRSSSPSKDAEANAKHSPKTFKIVVDKLIHGGAGLGRHEGKVIFVPFSVPGDHLRVRTVEEKKNFTRAITIRILKPGPGRVAPVCSHFGKCGGCHWQHLDYSRQVEAKRQILEEILHHRFPQTRQLLISMRACPQPYAYRSRARIQLRGAGNKSSIGFFRQRSRTIEDVEMCPLLRPSLNEALAALRKFRFQETFNPGPQQVAMACSEEEDSWDTHVMESNLDESLSDMGLTEGRNEEILLHKKAGKFRYSTTASAFFQANDFMLNELVTTAQELAKNGGKASALDLYSGVGFFSLPLAQQYRKVVAVENSPSASRLCHRNATSAGIDNIQVVCADVFTWMEAEGSIKSPEFDLILLDPPRTGAGQKVMTQIKEWAPAVIIYVSCDPQTLCRDIAFLSDLDYQIDLVEGLDLFPQTYHFETIVRLKRC